MVIALFAAWSTVIWVYLMANVGYKPKQLVK